MPFLPLKFRPGLIRDLTAYSTEGGWYDSNLVRFRLGFPESIGGWVCVSDTTFEGSARSLHAWTALDNSDYLGVGTHTKFYIENDTTFNDITPIRRTATPSTPFAATDGSDTLTVTDTGHGAGEGDFVTFSGADSLGGLVTADELNKEFEIATIVDGDSYTVTLAVTANASDTGDGGASVSAAYQLNIGSDTQIGGTGWGAGAWSEDGWGSASSTPVGATLRIWSQDNFGEDLVYGVRDGNIYYWDKTSGLAARGVAMSTLASSDAGTPTLATQVLVSEVDRHVIALGTNRGGSTAQDPLLIRFSGQESVLVWDETASNTAGELRLSTGSRIIRGLKTKREILVWTDSALYSMQFIGPPFIFGVQQLAANITVNSFNGMAAVEDTVYWMGRDVFYVYAGQTQEIPCPVKDYVFSDINRSQRDKVFAGVNTEFNEVTWFYPSAGSSNNDRYVTYNYVDNAWYIGALARTAWLDRGLRAYPLATSPDHYLYAHEFGRDNGCTNPPTPLNAYIESSPFDLGDGDKQMFIREVIPDVTFVDSDNGPTLTMTLTTQNYPGSARGGSATVPTSRSAPLPVEAFTEKVHVRLRGRSARLRIESNRVGTRWVLGVPRLQVREDGRQ